MAISLDDLKIKLSNYSELQKQRLLHDRATTPLPAALKGPVFTSLEINKFASLDIDVLKEFFPLTFDQPVLEIISSQNALWQVGSSPYAAAAPAAAAAPPDANQSSSASSSSSSTQPPIRVGAVFCGRQTPGGHNVICGIFDYLCAHHAHPDTKLYGFIEGTRGLFKNHHVQITEEIVSVYRNQGGYDMLGRSVDSIRKSTELQSTLHTCQALQLNALVLIGGPTTLTDAAHLAEFLASQQRDSPVKTRVIGVPATIDGDIKNRYMETTVGFDTACKVYSSLIGNIAIDGMSATKYYYFIRLMGRAPSHITLECALQTNPNIVLIGEEVEASMKPLSQIVDEICDMIVDRSNSKKDFGVVLLSEGLVGFVPEIQLLVKELNEIIEDSTKEHIPQEQLNKYISDKLSPWNAATFNFLPADFRQQLLLERETGGSMQLSQIEMERLLATLVEIELKARKKAGTYKGSFAAITHFFGYQARSSLPSLFDSNLAYSLGYASGEIAAQVQHVTGVAPSLRNLASTDVNTWKVWVVPLVLMIDGMADLEHNGKKAVPAIQSARVDLRGKPFHTLQERRDKWRNSEVYSNPGPIQFQGPSASATLITLQVEQHDSTEKLRHVDAYCDALKVACRAGCSDEILDAALIGLSSLTKILQMMK